jgi:glycerol-3-phosphate acyltransferase PlsY
MALLILYKHKNNITRLMDGSEPKIFIKSNVINQIMKEEPNSKVLAVETEPRIRPTSVKLKKPPVKKIATHKNETIKSKQTSGKKTDEVVKAKQKTTNASTKSTKPKPKPKPKTKPKATQKKEE